jgi:hypothetical protein
MWRMGVVPGKPAGATVERCIRAVRLVLGEADFSSPVRATPGPSSSAASGIDNLERGSGDAVSENQIRGCFFG